MTPDDQLHKMSDRLEIAWQRRRASVALATRRRRFREFYRGLPDKQNIFYMFFTRGLLHWVAKSISYVPDNVNLVLLGSALPEHEQEWLRTLGRPFHHIDKRINDKLAWTLLFDVNEHNFGWLDIDCFVLNSELFGEMSTIAEKDSVNGAWWYDTDFGFELSATYFQFFNVNAIRALRAARLAASPNCYAHRTVCCPPLDQRYFSEPMTRRVRRQLLTVVPADEAGRPRAPGREPYFDTTVVPQLMARALGFGAGHIRELRRLAWNLPGFEEISDELVHIGAVSYASVLSEYYRPLKDPGMQMRYLLADFVALRTTDLLPAPYAERRDFIVSELARHGMSPEDAEEAARCHLIDERGLSEAAADRVVSYARDLPTGHNR